MTNVTSEIRGALERFASESEIRGANVPMSGSDVSGTLKDAEQVAGAIIDSLNLLYSVWTQFLGCSDLHKPEAGLLSKPVDRLTALTASLSWSHKRICDLTDEIAAR